MIDIHVVLLSLLQGLTEFLPVSSSGHLVLFSLFTTFPDQGLAMDVALHLGSIFAVLIYFWRTIWDVIVGVFKTYFIPNFKNPGARLFWLVVVGTIPVVIAGILIRKYGIEFRDGKIIGWTITGYAILLFAADKVGLTIRKINHLRVSDALLIGAAQCLALIPGTSRSGVTITMARFLGMERKEAAKFSMILSIPAIVGATVLVAWEIYSTGSLAEVISYADGVVWSFVFSIMAIYLFMKWLEKYTFLPFVIYRIGLGIFLLLDAYGYIDFLNK